MKHLVKKIVWQAQVFTMAGSVMERGQVVYPPVALVFDPYRPYIWAARVLPEGASQDACLVAAVEEALMKFGGKPSEVHVRWGQEKALERLARRTGFTLMICDQLPELEAVKADMTRHLLAGLGVPASIN